MSVTKEFEKFCDSKFEELKNYSFEELLNLASKTYKWNKNGREGKLTIAIEEVDKDTIRVILQGHLPFRFFSFILHPFVDGFRKKRDGSVEAVTYDEISHYD